MYSGRYGLGDTSCPAGQVYTASVGACVDDISGGLPDINAGANASNAISLTIPSGLTLNAAGQVVTAQSFTDWVTANSTLLLVLFGAVGALVALTRVGK